MVYLHCRKLNVYFLMISSHCAAAILQILSHPHYKTAWARLRRNPWVKAAPEIREAMHAALSSVHERIRLAPFEYRPSYDILSLFPKGAAADSLTSQIAALHWRPEGEDAYETFAPLVVFAPLAVPTSLFDSQLATIVYQTVGVLPPSIEARAVLPAALIGRASMPRANASAEAVQAGVLFSGLLFACPVLVREPKRLGGDAIIEQSIQLEVADDGSAATLKSASHAMTLDHNPLFSGVVPSEHKLGVAAVAAESVALSSGSNVQLESNPLFGVEQPPSSSAMPVLYRTISANVRMQRRVLDDDQQVASPVAAARVEQRPDLKIEIGRDSSPDDAMSAKATVNQQESPVPEPVAAELPSALIKAAGSRLLGGSKIAALAKQQKAADQNAKPKEADQTEENGLMNNSAPEVQPEVPQQQQSEASMAAKASAATEGHHAKSPIQRSPSPQKVSHTSSAADESANTHREQVELPAAAAAAEDRVSAVPISAAQLPIKVRTIRAGVPRSAQPPPPPPPPPRSQPPPSDSAQPSADTV
jgi:hypothetical protein